MVDDVTITLEEFRWICEAAGIEPLEAMNKERRGREGIVFTQLVFLTSDDNPRAGHRFTAAISSVLTLEHALFIADRIGWACDRRVQINIDDVIVEGLPTRGIVR